MDRNALLEPITLRQLRGKINLMEATKHDINQVIKDRYNNDLLLSEIAYDNTSGSFVFSVIDMSKGE